VEKKSTLGIKQTHVNFILFNVKSFVLRIIISSSCKLCVCGFGYELLILRLWLVKARTRP
jgi:hypothetical protein